MAQALREVLSEELNRPVAATVQAIADVLRARYERAAVAVLFYGSCLRSPEAELADNLLDFYVLVDDYDLVASSSGNPLAILRDHLGQARDIGLHVILTRRTGGAGRALYEPVMMTIRELGSPGIIMSGDREEGPLLGNVRPSLQPPGRGWLVTRRGGVRLIQLAWLPPST